MPVLNSVIDLSHHEDNVDFETARDHGIVGVFHKATQGTSFVDPKYQERRQQALDAGLLWGAYHFGDGEDGLAQASHFLDTVKPTASELLVLDYEANPSGTTMTLDGARAFVSVLHAATGRWPGLYSGHKLRDDLGDTVDPVLRNCWLWLARYGAEPVVQASWSGWTMWQYTDGTSGDEPHDVEGVGPCDRDQFNGDFLALVRLWSGVG